MPRRSLVLALVCAASIAFSCLPCAADENRAGDSLGGVLPLGADGQPLNLNFEKGTLEDWLAEGEAFADQPIEGDTVHRRRGDMRSNHAGRYWIGTFERHGDEPQGTLTSAPFRVTQPFASFLVGGGSHRRTCVELVRRESDEVIFRVSGRNEETMRRVVCDLTAHQGEEIFIRLVDQHSGGWGHINFDDFRLHAERPDVPDGHVVPPQDTFAHHGLVPEKAAEVMTLPHGFKVTLCAAEPEVQQPIAMALDNRGRLWVAEGHTYPQRATEGQGRDRIVIFTDRNGDGRFDERKVFCEGLNLVSGLEVGFGGVWVGAAPYLLFIPDADGDDVPDGPPQVLLDGWGYQDTHETLNAFIWGPDGWLYGCHGVFTHSRVGKPGTPDERRERINAGIWRYHPTRHEFEVFAHGTSNPWGVDFNDHGQAFLTACVIPHLFHVIQGARYRRQAGAHFNRHTYDDIKTIADHVHYLGATPHLGNAHSDAAGGGHAHCGAMIYLGGRWPEEYRNQIFMNNIHGARINMDLLEPRGSGYVGRHGPDFLLANDSWSQIINLRYGPDGQVYFLDWYDRQQCHLPQIEAHDRSNGRIFKIAYDDGVELPAVVDDLRERSDAELAELQLAENDWFVRHARRILQERAATRAIDRAAIDRLRGLAHRHDDDTRRLRALWCLHVTGELNEADLRRGLADESPYVRGWSIQLAVESRDVSSERLAELARMAKEDDSQVVRLYLASAADRLPLELRWAILEGLAHHAADDAEDHNLPLVCWYAAEPLAEADADRALALADRFAAGPMFAHMVRRVAADGSDESLSLLVAHLDRIDAPARQLELLRGVREALKGRRQVAMPAAWPSVGRKLVTSPHAEVQSEAMSLAVTFGDAEALAGLRDVLVDTAADLARREMALEALLAIKDDRLAPALVELLAEPRLRGRVLRAMAAYHDPAIAAAILEIYATLPPPERRDALHTLTSRLAYAQSLLDAIEADQIAGTDLSADLVRQLRNLQDDEINRRLNETWGTVRESTLEKALAIEKYKKLVGNSDPGSATLGRAVFARTCQQCHTLFGIGGNVGPDLTGSNRADLDYLLSNILDPTAVMAKDYMATTVVTTDGRIVTGIVREQNDASVTVVTEKETLVLPRDEIDEMQESDKSMMPDDLLKPLGDDEVRALVAYLAGPAQVPMQATADNVHGLFNGRDLTGWSGDAKLWSVEEGEIVGKSAGLDHNSFLVSDLLAADFRLSLEVRLVGNRGNSGIQFRSIALDDGEVQGYQADIGQEWWGKLYEERGRGLLWDRSGESHVEPDGWNRYEIEAVGSRIRTWINGQICADLDDPAGRRDGIFALQLHSGAAMEVRFRNLKLELNPDTELAGPTTAGGN